MHTNLKACTTWHRLRIAARLSISHWVFQLSKFHPPQTPRALRKYATRCLQCNIHSHISSSNTWTVEPSTQYTHWRGVFRFPVLPHLMIIDKIVAIIRDKQINVVDYLNIWSLQKLNLIINLNKIITYFHFWVWIITKILNCIQTWKPVQPDTDYELQQDSQ